MAQDYNTPFGGYKQSGIGRENGEYALDNYYQVSLLRGNVYGYLCIVLFTETNHFIRSRQSRSMLACKNVGVISLTLTHISLHISCMLLLSLAAYQNDCLLKNKACENMYISKKEGMM